MRVQHVYCEAHTPTNAFSINYSNFHNSPAKVSRSAKQHPSNSAHLLKRFVRGLSKCIYQFFIPIDLKAQFPTCAATRGAGMVGTRTHPSIPNTGGGATIPSLKCQGGDLKESHASPFPLMVTLCAQAEATFNCPHRSIPLRACSSTSATRTICASSIALQLPQTHQQISQPASTTT
jgi:hypothetical protein